MSLRDDDPLRPYIGERDHIDPDALLYLAVSVLADRAALTEPNLNEQGQYRRGAQDAYVYAIRRIQATANVGRLAAGHIAQVHQEQAEIWADVLEGDLNAWLNDPAGWSA